MGTKKSLGTYKARRVGHSLVIPIPTSFPADVGEKFEAEMGADGKSLIFVKAESHNPWVNGQFDGIDFRADMDLVNLHGMGESVGRERVDDE